MDSAFIQGDLNTERLISTRVLIVQIENFETLSLSLNRSR